MSQGKTPYSFGLFGYIYKGHSSGSSDRSRVVNLILMKDISSSFVYIVFFFMSQLMKLHGCRIERLELFDEFEEWHMMQVIP